MIRATKLAWIPVVLELLSVTSSGSVVADSSPTPSSPSPTPSPSPPPAVVSLSTNSGPAGTWVSVTGSGFPPSNSLAIYVDASDQGYVATPARLNGGVGPQTDSRGSFRQDVIIPYAEFGPHSVCADTNYPGSSASSAVKACAQFSIQAQVSLSVGSGPPGTDLKFKGTGFPARNVIRIYLESEEAALAAGAGGLFFNDRYVDEQGGFIEPIVWPTERLTYHADPLAAGPHSICGSTFFSKVKACAQFVVIVQNPIIKLSPDSGPVDTIVKVTAGGLAPASAYKIAVDRKLVVCSANQSDFVTDTSGGFVAQLAVKLNMDEPRCFVGPVVISYGRHRVCGYTDPSLQACADFVLLGGPTPAAARGAGLMGQLQVSPVVVFIGVAILVALAAGSTVWVLRRRDKTTIPPSP